MAGWVVHLQDASLVAGELGRHIVEPCVLRAMVFPCDPESDLPTPDGTNAQDIAAVRNSRDILAELMLGSKSDCASMAPNAT